MNNKTSRIIDLPSKVAGCNSDIWISIAKCAELLKIKPQSIREAIKERNGKYKNGCYIFRNTLGNGGRQYEILLTSLPEHIQAEYWIKNSKPAHSTLPALTQEKENHPFDSDVYEAIADTYSRKSAGIKEKAQRKLYILDEYLGLLEGGFNQESALNILNQRHKKISRATLWRWLRSVEKHPRQYWEVILAPDFKGRGRNKFASRALHLSPRQDRGVLRRRKPKTARYADFKNTKTIMFPVARPRGIAS